MALTTRVQDAVCEACTAFLDTWLMEPDVEALAKMLHPDVAGFGPGGGAGVKGADAVLALLGRFVDQDQGGCRVQWLKPGVVAEDCGMVLAKVELQGTERRKYEADDCLCLSCVFRQADGAWLLAGLHVAQATGAPERDEADGGLDHKIGALQRMVEEKTDKLNEAINEIGILATTDKLTGVFNRMKLDQILDSELHRSERYKNPFSVITIDIDGFKRINEAHGYILGDYILIHFAKLLLKRVRKTDIVGRWGGEEFFVICPETPRDAGTMLAEDIRAAVEQSEFRGVADMTASFGVAAYQAEDSRDTLLARADNALGRAKDQGGNNVVAA